MTRSEMQNKIKILRDELENRYKYGVVKIANEKTPISVEQIQSELYALIYKLSKSE